MSVAQLVEFEQSEAAKAAERYEELLAAIEAGHKIDQRKGAAVLSDAGKTVADVNAEVQRRKRVAELREVIAKQAEYDERRGELGSRAAAKRAELDAVTTRLWDEIAELEREQKALNSQCLRIDEARRELRKLVPQSQQAVELQRESKKLMENIARLERMLLRQPDPRARKDEIAALDTQIAKDREAIAGEGWLTRIGIQRRLVRLEAERKELAQFDHLEPRFVELEAARARLKQIVVERAALIDD